jgi:hypothetical protein
MSARHPRLANNSSILMPCCAPLRAVVGNRELRDICSVHRKTRHEPVGCYKLQLAHTHLSQLIDWIVSEIGSEAGTIVTTADWPVPQILENDMRSSILVMCLGLMAATPALAENAPAQSGPNSFTEGQAKSRIEDAGFTNVTELKKDDKGVWRGEASKGGSATAVSVDFQGNVNSTK